MKKKLVALVLLLIFCLTGCTIDMTNSKKTEEDNSNLNDEEKLPDDEKIEHTGIDSTLENPLNIEQVGLASKYNAVLNAYQDVDVEILQIYDNSDEIINDYNLENPDKKIETKNGYKFVVLDYKVRLVNFETESFGTDVTLDVEILDNNGNSFIVDGVKQVITINNLKESFGVTNGETGVVTIAFQIPDVTTSYLIKIGTINHTIAYYKI